MRNNVPWLQNYRHFLLKSSRPTALLRVRDTGLTLFQVVEMVQESNKLASCGLTASE